MNNEAPVEFCGLRKDKAESYYPIDQGFLKISHPDLSCVSQLDLGTQMISNSYYQE